MGDASHLRRIGEPTREDSREGGGVKRTLHQRGTYWAPPLAGETHGGASLRKSENGKKVNFTECCGLHVTHSRRKILVRAGETTERISFCRSFRDSRTFRGSLPINAAEGHLVTFSLVTFVL